MNTPKIRFKGFTDDWEQRKFKELCDMVTVGIANSATHAYSDSGVVMFRNQNIKPNFLDDTDIIHINSEFEVKYKNKRLKKNDLLVARTGYPGTACVVPEKYENSQTFTTLIARPNENVDPYFLCQYLNSDIGIKYFESTQIGGGQKNSGAGILNEMPVTLPSTIEEEKKIGDYFRILDHLITLHQRKCDETKQLKKFMLQKMFPKNGEKNPEIRFEGFTDDWEQRKFSELYAKSSEKNDGSIGMDKNITVATMQFKEDVKVSTAEYLKTYYTFNLGDIAFEGHQSKEFRYGRFVENDIGNGIVSHIFAVFRPIREYDLHFWKYAINNEALMQRILSRSTKASTMMHDLVTNDFLNETFLVPSLDEQRRIGVFLDTLDHLITLHQRKCEKLKELKKFMLQNMFV